ncbi:single-stranded DNA-binding protein [Weissella confusa]|uniref:single-stranded DNA-binding protein n=1 Tax=Weissella confusa TaxID=1583 RepID=UPI001C6F713C|nr:single-stranded DNA-binding protein [Weissella confusa]QYU56751.1 single-stranded DNA-binding protein [Weissella confusa]
MQVNNHVGRVTVLPKLVYVGQNNLAKVTFGLAIDSDVTKNKTNFLYYEAIGKTAELINQFVTEKGTVLEVSFEIQSRQFTTQAGEKKTVFVNVVTRFKVWASPKREKNPLENGEPLQDNYAPIQQDYSVPDTFIDYEN